MGWWNKKVRDITGITAKEQALAAEEARIKEEEMKLLKKKDPKAYYTKKKEAWVNVLDMKINKDNIKIISELVVNKVNPEYRAQVLESFLTSTNFDVSEIQERFGNAIFNAAEGSVEKASKILSEAPSGSSMSIDNFDISFRPTRPMTTEDLNTANKAIDNIIQANFGNLYTGDGETYQGEDAPEVGRIRNEMMEVYKNTWDTATYTGNPIDILYSLGDSIYQQTRQQNRPAAEVVVTPNWQDLPDYNPPPPIGGGSDDSGAEEDLTDENPYREIYPLNP